MTTDWTRPGKPYPPDAVDRVLRFSNRQALEDLDAVLETLRKILLPQGGKGRVGGVSTQADGRSGQTSLADLQPAPRVAPPLPTPSPSTGRGDLG